MGLRLYSYVFCLGNKFFKGTLHDYELIKGSTKLEGTWVPYLYLMMTTLRMIFQCTVRNTFKIICQNSIHFSTTQFD